MTPEPFSYQDEIASLVRQPMVGTAGAALVQALESGAHLNFIDDFPADTRDAALFAITTGLYSALMDTAAKIERLEGAVGELYGHLEAAGLIDVDGEDH